jgi:hypothetical protein
MGRPYRVRWRVGVGRIGLCRAGRATSTSVGRRTLPLMTPSSLAEQAGLWAAEQTHLFAAPTVRALSPDPAMLGPDGQPSTAKTATDEISSFAVTFGRLD